MNMVHNRVYLLILHHTKPNATNLTLHVKDKGTTISVIQEIALSFDEFR